MAPLRTRLAIRTRTWTAGLVATLALTAAGCGGGSGQHHTAPSPSRNITGCQPAMSARCGPVRAPAPAPITPEGARAVLTNYIKINNAANQALSRQLNNQIETGAVHAQSQAEFTTFPWWTKDEKTSIAPFSYVQPRIYLPRASASAKHPWFAVLAHYSTAKNLTSFMIFIKEGTAWKLSAETGFDAGQVPPPIAVDADGYATSIGPDDAAGLAMKPSTLPLAVNDNYLTGGTGDGTIFAKSPDTTQQRKSYKDAKTFLRPYAASEFTTANDPYGAVYALKTVGGGALVIASSAHNQYDHVIYPGGSINLGPHSRERAWVHTSSVQMLTTTFTCLDAAAVTPKGGKADLLGSDCEITGAS